MMFENSNNEQITLEELNRSLLDFSEPDKALALLGVAYLNGQTLEAWKALEFCLNFNIPFPLWLKEYLLEVSGNLRSINKPGQKVGPLVAKALKLHGKHFTRDHDLNRDIKICISIEEMARRGKTYSLAYKTVSKELKLSIPAVKKVHLGMCGAPTYKEMIDYYLSDACSVPAGGWSPAG